MQQPIIYLGIAVGKLLRAYLEGRKKKKELLGEVILLA
jgi:hypothetical protein